MKTLLEIVQTASAVSGGAIVMTYPLYGCILIGIGAGILAIRIKYYV